MIRGKYPVALENIDSRVSTPNKGEKEGSRVCWVQGGKLVTSQADSDQLLCAKSDAENVRSRSCPPLRNPANPRVSRQPLLPRLRLHPLILVAIPLGLKPVSNI